jgi:N,N'-diacetyllegionaminate synthase
MSIELIGECATNHGGSLSLALEFVDAFSPYVDTLKFQLTRVAHLRQTDPQYDWFRRAELSLEQWADVQAACHKRGVSFLLTVYNAMDVWELAELGCNRVKIGSGEAREVGLADAVRSAGLKPIVSCGLSHVEYTAYWPHATATFLGCVTRYPSPSGVAAAVLSGEPKLSGWSDHAIGTGELEAAACIDARILETHVFLRNQARPIRPFEKSTSEMAHLRAFLDENPTRFLGRWQA